MTNKIIDFIKENKVKIIIAIIIVLILAGLFILGKSSSGKEINYIPI